MKLKFDSYPLNIYSDVMSISLLREIDTKIPKVQHSRLSISQYILSSFVNKAAGGWAASLVGNAVTGAGAILARNCLAGLISEQVTRTTRNPSLLLREAQLNLMATDCVTEYLSHLECESIGTITKTFAKSVLSMIKNLSFSSGFDEIGNSVIEISEKYDDISQVYHIAFLLNAYCANPKSKEIIIKLITESLCKDGRGSLSFSTKKRPILFSNVQSKTLEENLQNRLFFLIEGTKGIEGLYDPFIKWRKELNDESGK